MTSKNGQATLDDFFKLGRYTLLVCLFSEFCILNQVGNMLYMMYAGVAPNVVGCGDHNFTQFKTQHEICVHLTEVIKNSSCEPILETQFESVNYDWSYYCSETKKVKTSISAQMIGVMVGSVLFGQASDIFGRKLVILSAVICCQIFMLLSSFTHDLFWFTACRFFVNVFNGGSIAISMVFVIENIPKKDRIWINNLVAWAPNIMIFAVLAYFAGDWRTLTRTSAALSIPAIIVICIISESPRYLIQRGKLEEAKGVIQRMCRIDGRTFDEEGLEQILARENQKFLESRSKTRNYSFFHLFYTAKLARYTIALGFTLIVTSIMNYSLIFNMERLSGSIYLNGIFLAGIRLIFNNSIALVERTTKCVGRKMIHFGALIFVEVWLVVLVYIYATDTTEVYTLLSRLAPLLIVGISSQFYILNGVVSNELFPTAIRNLSYAFSQFCSRVGTVLSPNIFLLSDYWDALPYATMLVLAVINQFFFQFIIPETKGQPLNDHMPGPEQRIFRSKRAKNELILKDPEVAEKLKSTEEK